MATKTKLKSQRAESDCCDIPGMVDSSYLLWSVGHNTLTRGLLRIPVSNSLKSFRFAACAVSQLFAELSWKREAA